MDGRRQAWAISCIGEPAAEIEDAFTDEVPIAFGRQVLRLTRAGLGRPWDKCVPSPARWANVRSRLRAAAYRGSCRPRSRPRHPGG
jgi:hypothetical protein